jgi:hypothetical protein
VAARRFRDLYGIGPFLVGYGIQPGNPVYRGRPAPEPVVIDVALAQAGELVIELIAQQSAGPSAFRDMYPDGGPGLHHVAAWSADYAKDLQALVDEGLEVAMETQGRGDYRMCFVDARRELGHMIELYPDHPSLRALYARIRGLADTWDGRELLLPL